MESGPPQAPFSVRPSVAQATCDQPVYSSESYLEPSSCMWHRIDFLESWFCWSVNRNSPGILTSQNEKKSKNGRKIEFKKNHEKLIFNKMCVIRPNFNILSSILFANILILIVLTDSVIKTLCYMRSYGVNFENSEIFRFLRGPKGGFPPKISNYFFAKN